MKENKKFFYNNRLNKGYSKISNPEKTDLSLMRKRYKHMLPPLDLLEEYEEQYPGTFDKLLNMAQKEQEHRHAIEILALEKCAYASKMGRIFSAILVALIITGTFMLVVYGAMFMAALFVLAAFSCIMFVSYFTSFRRPKNKWGKNEGKYNNKRIHNS